MFYTKFKTLNHTIFYTMHKINLLFISLFFTMICKGQDNWAPIGAKWIYYHHHYMQPGENYVVWQSLKDTAIQGKSCKFLGGQSYTYSDSGKVFIWDNSRN